MRCIVRGERGGILTSTGAGLILKSCMGGMSGKEERQEHKEGSQIERHRETECGVMLMHCEIIA